jgi:hypothetical protein
MGGVKSMTPNDDELMTATEARKYLGVNKVRMATYTRLDKNGHAILPTYEKPLGDRRVRWVRKVDVEALKKRMNEVKKLAPAA